MNSWGKNFGIAFSILIMMVGCSPSETTSSPTPISFPSSSFINGDWSWEFKADGTFVSSGPLGSETGTYSVKGDQVVITCQCCGDVEGTYAWSFDGTNLKFIAIDDKCTNRKDVVDASVWLKKP